MTPPIQNLRIKLYVKVKQARKLCKTKCRSHDCKQAWIDVIELSNKIDLQYKKTNDDLDVISIF